LNVFFDLRAIYKDLNDEHDIRTMCKTQFTKICSDDTLDDTFEQTCVKQAAFPPLACFPRLYEATFTFLGSTYAWPAHAVAMPFEDNHLFLMRNTFRLRDSDAKYASGRLSLPIMISGGAKSIVLAAAHDVLVNDKVKAALSGAREPAIHKLKDLKQVTTQGSNIEGLYADAKKLNDPCGLRSFHDEVGDTMCKLGQATEKDKFLPRQVITINNPVMTSGKRLGGGTSSIPNMKVNMSAATQCNVAHLFLPFTKEGESYRWNVALVGDRPGLAVKRGHELVDKTAFKAWLTQGLEAQILHLTGTEAGLAEFLVDDRTKGIASLYEDLGSLLPGVVHLRQR
jgi:hypothetical protein